VITPPQNTATRRARAVNGLGDLNILLNPATEAYQFGRIDCLYRQLKFPDSQTPQLVVFSADNDWARKAFFPISRILTSLFRPGFRGDYQAELFGQALGILEAQQTHEIPIQASGEPRPPDSLTDSDYVGEDGKKVRVFDFSDTVIFGGVTMRRLPVNGSLSPAIVNSPVSVVVVKDHLVMNMHDDIFLDPFQKFLASYVAFIEGKRLMIRHERHQGHLQGMKDPDPCNPSDGTRLSVLAVGAQ
jgi:hypothetical protein